MDRLTRTLFELAIAEPLNTGPVKVAAALVYKGRVVATGTNQYKTHPLMMTPGYREDQNWRHAEVDCIVNARRTLTLQQIASCSIHVVRAKRTPQGKWTLGLAKPCPGCSRVIKNYGIAHVSWSEDKYDYEVYRNCKHTRGIALL